MRGGTRAKGDLVGPAMVGKNFIGTATSKAKNQIDRGILTPKEDKKSQAKTSTRCVPVDTEGGRHESKKYRIKKWLKTKAVQPGGPLAIPP